jgi:HD superfamily phosphohydrolase
MLENLSINEPKLKVSDEDRQLLRLAVLLHDLGHYPFSHVIERVMKRTSGNAGKHEMLSRFLLESKTDWGISQALNKANMLDKVVKFFKGTYPAPALYGYLISSDLDVDRLDYLQRDSVHTGVAYGAIDAERILRTATVDNAENPSFLVAMSKGTHAVENYILARYHMYNSVYFHKVITAFELMLERLYELLSDDTVGLLPNLEVVHKMSEEEFTAYDDSCVLSALANYLKKSKSDAASELIRMLYARTPVKEAYREFAVTEMKELKFDKLREDTTDTIRDRLAQESGINKDWIFVTEREIPIMSDTDEEAIYVQNDGRPVKIADDERSIVSKLGRLGMRGYRIFTKPEFVEKLSTSIGAMKT